MGKDNINRLNTEDLEGRVAPVLMDVPIDLEPPNEVPPNGSSDPVESKKGGGRK